MWGVAIIVRAPYEKSTSSSHTLDILWSAETGADPNDYQPNVATT